MNNFSFVNGSLTCCICGSTRIAKRYIHDLAGEVEGQSRKCLDCGEFDSGR